MHVSSTAALKHIAERVERLPAYPGVHELRDACEEIAGELREIARGGRIEASRKVSPKPR